MKYTFDDVLLVPQYSLLGSRSIIDIGSNLGTFGILGVPIISAAMDTITGLAMVKEMGRLGGHSIHHRYVQNQAHLRDALEHGGSIAVSPSMGIAALDKLSDGIEHVKVAIDVAHGDNASAIKFAEQCVGRGWSVMSGNICTVDAAKRYIDAGVNVLKVGIGGGSACTTRVISGCGYPQLSAIMEIYAAVPYGTKIVSDGGHKTSGDIVKALAAGADAVILGRLLAGTDECPGESTFRSMKFRGMASSDALKDAGKEVNPEGVSSTVSRQGSVESVINTLSNGIRAGFAYVGAANITELRKNADFIRISPGSYNEGMPRI
jgi:IMP dehydrogenase